MSITTELPQSVQRPTSLRHFVLASLLAITAVNYVQRNCISPMATTIESALSLSGQQLDLIMGAFFWAYTFMMVPSSWLAQRWGPRLALTLYAAGWSLATLACALATGFLGLFLARIAMGLLQAGIFPCATLILAVWFPQSQRGLASALLNSFMLMGGAAGSMITGVLLEPVGWRWVFALFAVPGLLWAVWFLWWFRNRPQDHPGVNQAELALISEAKASDPAPPVDRDAAASPLPIEPDARPPAASARSYLLLFFSLPLILLCTQQCFRAAANRLFDSRLPTYLEKERGLTKARAAILSSWPQWVGIVGGVTGGALSDWLLRRTRRPGRTGLTIARKGLAIASLLVSSTIYLLAYTIADVTLAMAVLSAGFFVFCFSSPCAYALTMDMGGKHLAIVFGLMNMAGNLGAAAFVSSVITLVTLGGWPFALAVWLGLHLAAVVCWLFLNPNTVIGEDLPSR